MNRSAKCIKMLEVLKSRGRLQKEELANILNTNVRNISIYRKELIEAGYNINVINGHFGGYELVNNMIMPILALRVEEVGALRACINVMRQRKDFLELNELEKAFDKIFASLPNMHIREQVNKEHNEVVLDNQSKAMIRTLQGACSACKVVELNYKSVKSLVFKKILVHPYIVFHYQQAYYCIAFALKADGFRMYRCNAFRMRDIKVLDKQFARDPNFKYEDYIGSSGLVKEEVIAIEVLVFDDLAFRTQEKQIGFDQVSEWLDERTLKIQTKFESKMQAIAFLLSLQDSHKLIAPSFLVEEMRLLIKRMGSSYK